MDLEQGANTITVTVTAADGVATLTYTVTVTRAAPLSTTPDAFTFNPREDVAPGEEITSNAITISGLDLEVALSVTGGTVNIGNAGANTADGVTMGRVVNDNTVAAVVTSGACGESVTATVTIGGVVGDFVVSTRACRTATTLQTLMFADVALAESFMSAVTAYTASVVNAVATTTVAALPTEGVARVEVRSNRDDMIGADGTVELAVGENVITVTVTAENGAMAELHHHHYARRAASRAQQRDGRWRAR